MQKRNKKPVPEMGNKQIPVRMSEKTHQRLKKLAYLTNKSMSLLAKESIEKMLLEQKSILTNSDIVIS